MCGSLKLSQCYTVGCSLLDPPPSSPTSTASLLTVQRSHLLVWQRVNHFKHAKELTRKDLLKKNLARYQVLGQKMNSMFTILPPTFVLPKEYALPSVCPPTRPLCP